VTTPPPTSPLVALWLDFARELIAADCESVQRACRYLEIQDTEGFRKVVEGNIEGVKESVRAKREDAAQAVGDAIALAILFGARAAKRGLL
jgi:hypothetical protein